MRGDANPTGRSTACFNDHSDYVATRAQAFSTSEHAWRPATGVVASLLPRTARNLPKVRCSQSYPTATGRRMSAATVFMLSLMAAAT